jgi:hypothetical protein
VKGEAIMSIRFSVPSQLGIDRPVRRALHALAAMPDDMSREEARAHLALASRLWAEAAEQMQEAADTLAAPSVQHH